MVHFSCPICKRAFDFPDSMAGEKFACECGQRIQVPVHAKPMGAAKTVLGEMTEDSTAAMPPPHPSTLMPPALPPPVREPMAEPREQFRCYECGNWFFDFEVIRREWPIARTRSSATGWNNRSFSTYSASGSSTTYGQEDVCQTCSDNYDWMQRLKWIIQVVVILAIVTIFLVSFVISRAS